MDTLIIDEPTLEEAYYVRRYGQRIGQGAFRDVYHNLGLKWAYKFEAWWKYEKINIREYENYLRFKDSFDKVAFPEFKLLSPEIIAVEYVDGILGQDIHTGTEGKYCPCITQLNAHACWRTVAKQVELHILDINGRNIKFSRIHKKFYVIDIGGSTFSYANS
jgi:hypothetical protein